MNLNEIIILQYSKYYLSKTRMLFEAKDMYFVIVYKNCM